MSIVLRSPIGRWIAMSLMVPLIAALLNRVGQAVQKHHGGPTHISQALLGMSRFATRRRGRPTDPVLVDPTHP